MIKLCKTDSLQNGASLGFEQDGVNVFVVQIHGKIGVYENHCPHLGTTLEFMPNQFLSIDKSLILCSTHGALFEHGSGACVSGPCAGQHLTVIPFVVEDDWICISSNPLEWRVQS